VQTLAGHGEAQALSHSEESTDLFDGHERYASVSAISQLLSFINQSTLKINLTNIFSSETLQSFG
jgi:hypothetical protein